MQDLAVYLGCPRHSLKAFSRLQQEHQRLEIAEKYRPSYVSRAMLRISRMSGEKLTITLEDDLIPDVRAVKQHLNEVQGLPPRFRQRLLPYGQCLVDTAALQFSHGSGACCVGPHPQPFLLMKCKSS